MLQRTSGPERLSSLRITSGHVNMPRLMMPWLSHASGGSATMFHCDPWSLARVGKELGIGEFELLEIYRRKGIDN